MPQDDGDNRVLMSKYFVKQTPSDALDKAFPNAAYALVVEVPEGGTPVVRLVVNSTMKVVESDLDPNRIAENPQTGPTAADEVLLLHYPDGTASVCTLRPPYRWT